MTSRRGFLKGILAAGVAPVVIKSELLMPTRKLIVPRQELDIFGLAPIKQEGAPIIDLYPEKGIISAGSFPKALWPGVKAWYDSVYKDKNDIRYDMGFYIQEPKETK